MSEQKPDVVRASKSITFTQKLKLSQINISANEDFCHRDKKNYTKDENIAPLVESLLSEGLQVPLNVAEIKDNKDGSVVYVLVGGHRRLEAIRKIIRENRDTTRFHEEMELPVTVIKQGPDQTDQEYAEDVYCGSVFDNTVRQHFTEEERIQIVKKFDERKVPLPRAARALGIGEKQFQRIASVVALPWLLEMVVENKLNMTHAVKLLEAANRDSSQSVRNLKTLRDFLRRWFFAKEQLLSEQIARARKSQKPLSGSATMLKKFVTPPLLASWCECLGKGTDLSERAIVEFGINVDPKEGKIVVPGIEFRTKEGDPETLRQMIFEFQKAAEDATTLLEQVEYLRFITTATPEEKKRKAEEVRRGCEEEQRNAEKLEAGRKPAPEDQGEQQPPPSALDVTDELDTVFNDSEGA